MSAVIEKKQKTKKKAPPSADPKSLSGERLRAHPKQLTRHPDNRHPSEAAIEAVAASLTSEGQIEALTVRLLRGPDEFCTAPTYQIISGETRWHAARRLGWDSLACEVVQLDDAAALRVLAAANAARQDLDPIAKARLIVRLCEPIERGGSGLTREEAARMFDLQSGGAASNLVRLLELPEAWHGPIVSGALPQTFARALLPLLDLGLDSPAWGDTFEEWDRRGEGWSGFASRDDLEQYVEKLLAKHSRPVEKGDFQNYYKETGSYVDHPIRFKLTPNLEEELRIVELTIDGKTRRRATNCKLYDSFQIPAIKAYEAKRNKSRVQDDGEPEVSPEALSPKQLAAEEARRRDEANEKLAKRVERWRAAWLRELVAEAMAPGKSSEKAVELACGVAMWLVGHVRSINYREAALLGLDEFLPWKGVLQRNEMPTPMELVRRLLLLPGKDGYEHPMPDDKVEDLVELLGIDLDDRWLVAQGGRRLKVDPARTTRDADPHERYREFFELHNSEQLDELGQELGVGTAYVAKKSGKVDVFLNAAKTLKLPRCLRSLRKRGGK